MVCKFIHPVVVKYSPHMISSEPERAGKGLYVTIGYMQPLFYGRQQLPFTDLLINFFMKIRMMMTWQCVLAAWHKNCTYNSAEQEVSVKATDEPIVFFGSSVNFFTTNL